MLDNDKAEEVSGLVKRLKVDKHATIVCQDNLSFMRPLPAGSMKLIVTSPPYNIGKKYERRSKLEVYIQEQTRVIAECVRLLHPEGSICWQVGNHIYRGEVFPLDIILYHLFKDHGLKLRNRIIWQFEHGLHCKKRLSVLPCASSLSGRVCPTWGEPGS